jgi:hypothetical protein
MKYAESETLKDANNPPRKVPIFLRGEMSAAEWTMNDCQHGYDGMRLYPAWVDGNRMWLLSEKWHDADGFCEHGATESLIKFEAGIKHIITSGCADGILMRLSTMNREQKHKEIIRGFIS